jgi:hypothetical protein
MSGEYLAVECTADVDSTSITLTFTAEGITATVAFNTETASPDMSMELVRALPIMVERAMDTVIRDIDLVERGLPPQAPGTIDIFAREEPYGSGPN